MKTFHLNYASAIEEFFEKILKINVLSESFIENNKTYFVFRFENKL